jgi:hypothetical protein
MFCAIRQRAVQMYLDAVEVLAVESAVLNGVLLGNLNRVPAIAGFETGVTRLFTRLDTPEKRLEGAIHPEKRPSLTLEMPISKPVVISADRGEGSLLVIDSNRHASLVIGVTAFLQGGILKLPVLLQYRCQHRFLCLVWLQSVLIGAVHHLRAEGFPKMPVFQQPDRWLLNIAND